MQILDIKVLRGPNYWSNYRQKLIVLKLDIHRYENLPTNQLPNFYENLIGLLPSLEEHHCSLGTQGGFLQRLKEGTWVGHVVEHVALELQYLAGMDCTFGRARSSDIENVYYVVFAYEIEEAGLYAAEKSVMLVNNLAQGKTYSGLGKDIAHLKRILDKKGLGPSTRAIVRAAERRKIPITRLNNDSLIMFGHGKNQKLINATASSDTSIIGVDFACDKNLTKHILHDAYIPVPKGRVIRNLKELKEAIEILGYPLVIKPLDGNHGRGVTTNIMDLEQALMAYKLARRSSTAILVEHFINGFDYRFLVVDYKMVAAALRKPASIVGNGISTIQELIDETNLDPQRGEFHENNLTKIRVDAMTLNMLEKQDLSIESVLASGVEVLLKYSANISTGGTAMDVTDKIHPYNVTLVERIARLLHLNICGIDIVAHNIHTPITYDTGAVIEVNASPGIRMHLSPRYGKSRDVGKNIVDMLYPENSTSRIPLVAVTGTNGKTTIVRLISHFAMQAGNNVGYTTTDGIYINNFQIFKGDCSGPRSAASILRDPTVEFAVFECARGGILNSGLGFDHCNISIVTNITEDHLGMNGINTLEELSRLKSVVPRSTFKEGYAILNADDDLVFAMCEELDCNIALFSMQANNPRIIEHYRNGGLVAYVEEGNFTLQQGDIKKLRVNLSEVPLTYFGTASAMIQNIMPSLLAALISGFNMEAVTSWLKAFSPTPETLPGRMNLFKLETNSILIDYAHNVGAFAELKKYLEKVRCSQRIGIIGAPGDRRDEDIMNIGQYDASIFDEVIIKHDRDSRGRKNEEITALIKEGLKRVNPNLHTQIISDELQALEYAITHAKSGAFIAIFPEKIFDTINYVKGLEYLEIHKAKAV